MPASRPPIRIAIIGAGAVSDYHHVPGIRLDPRCELAAVCDTSEALLEQRKKDWGVDRVYTDPLAACRDENVDAVVIATPNFTHRAIAVEAANHGKHVMCEKPLGLNATEVEEMYHAARQTQSRAYDRVHVSLRAVDAVSRAPRQNRALGEPRHFRSQRFLDWPETSWGWRQYKATAGAGDLFDMTVHRLDFAMDLCGPLARICGAVARFVSRNKTKDGQDCPPSEVDDWSALIGEFRSGAVGVWEGTTLAKGYHRSGFGHEWAEINGAEGSAVYQLHEPNTILVGKTGDDLHPVTVPSEFLKPAGSPRDPAQGTPATVFRYDLMWEFVSAIVEGRDAAPSFRDGLNAQLVADAVLQSHASRQWMELELV